MPAQFVEGFLRFEFTDAWHVIKYDEHPDYVDRIKHLHPTKAVDFAAIFSGRELVLIEVKDFRGHRIENRDRITDGDLAVEVGQKVRDTLSGIVAANHRGNTEVWQRFAQCLMRTEPPLRVVLWLEDDLPPGPSGRAQNRASVMTDRLKRHLRWLTTKAFVLNLATNSLDGLAVRSLPGAGHRG